MRCENQEGAKRQVLGKVADASVPCDRQVSAGTDQGCELRSLSLCAPCKPKPEGNAAEPGAGNAEPDPGIDYIRLDVLEARQ